MFNYMQAVMNQVCDRRQEISELTTAKSLDPLQFPQSVPGLFRRCVGLSTYFEATPQLERGTVFTE
jgi:hypothetical protein